MRSELDCIPCFFAQAVRSARVAGLDHETTRQLLDELGQRLVDLDCALPPPANAAFLYHRLAELSGRTDPFAEAKQRHTEAALGLLAVLRRRVAEAPDPLDVAVRVAAAGNILDLGAMAEVGRVEDVIDRALEDSHVRWDLEALRDGLSSARRLLVLGDNAGETVFDRVLLETLHRLWPELEAWFSVRGGPIINDATMDDARAAGVDQVATLVSTGLALPGVVLDRVSAEFRALFDSADMVISKGQGNFEALSETSRELFFVLTVKCQVVARHLDLPRGASVLIHSPAG